MTEVSFEEEQTFATRPAARSQPALVRLVLRWGFASDQKGAERFLLWVIGACVLLAIAIFFFMMPDVPAPETPLDPSWPKPVVR